MIIYEVNLLVHNSIYNDYIKGLKKHITKMLTFKGFHKHQLYKITSKDLNETKLCVHYYINSLEDLEYYFDKYAERMKADGIKLFGKKINASRRILSTLE